MAMHKCDGHARSPKPEEIKTGVIVRRPESDGGLYQFSDSVVIGISFYTRPGENRRSYDSLAEALEHTKRECKDPAYIEVYLARPIAHAYSIGICFGCTVSVEKHSVSPQSILEYYKVIEGSTGKLATSEVRTK